MQASNSSRPSDRILSPVLALSLLLSLVATAYVARPASASHTPPNTYRNPVHIVIPGDGLVQTFADPSIIRAKDGFYYAYATADPLRNGGSPHFIPMARSNDLVHWTYVGDAFSALPPSAAPGAGLFAPDIRYFNDQYYLYYSITNTTTTPSGDDSAIGVATSPNPNGPFTQRGIVVEPQPNPCCAGSFRATIDPAEFTDVNGQRYMYFGSYFGGVFVRRLSASGLTTDPASERQVAIDNRYEGGYVVRHGPFYYMFASATNCCNFELTGYTVFAGRSRSPLGPFVDRQGVSFLAPRVGGTPVISMNGNRWVGPGHNAVLQDISGQDWFIYHAIDRFNPELRRSDGLVINRRPMLMDRLDWINGWPTVRGGSWASDGLQRAPVTSGPVYDELIRTSGIGPAWNRMGGAWRLVNPTRLTNKGYARQNWPGARSAMLISDGSSPSSYRAEFDLRLHQSTSATPRYGVVTSFRDRNNFVVAWLQPAGSGTGGFLVTEIRQGGVNAGMVRTALPSSFKFTDFHNLAVELRGRTLTFTVTDARLHDPLAVQVQKVPPHTTQQTAGIGAGRIGFATSFASADFDNASAAKLFTPVTRMRPNDRPGARLERFSDEFDGNLDPENGWSWVRQPPPSQFSLTERPGFFRFRTQNADLFKDSNNASVLIENAPAGDFTVQTRLQLNLPNDTSDRAFRQAGLVIYQNDDRYLKLVHVGIFDTRQTEWAKENGLDEPRYGNTVVGPPALTTYLRIVRKVNPATGLQLYTAYTSRDGATWVRGGTWTHRLGNIKIGLISMGGDGFRADFDYVRVFRP